MESVIVLTASALILAVAIWVALQSWERHDNNEIMRICKGKSKEWLII